MMRSIPHTLFGITILACGHTAYADATSAENFVSGIRLASSNPVAVALNKALPLAPGQTEPPTFSTTLTRQAALTGLSSGGSYVISCATRYQESRMPGSFSSQFQGCQIQEQAAVEANVVTMSLRELLVALGGTPF